MKNRIFIACVLLSGVLNLRVGPPNCSLFKDDISCQEACMQAEKAIMHPQGSRESQIHFDKSIELCPDFDYSYFEKSVPYGKRGLIQEWKKLMDKAVELNPIEYLGNRGWDHFIWMHNYKQAIADIEQLDALIDYDIGYTGDGIYHLNILKGLAWKGLKNYHKAIEVIETQMATEKYDPGLYDYLHLGVLYLNRVQMSLAIEAFNKQIEINDISEVHYYLAMAKLKNGKKEDEVTDHLNTALDYYQSGKKMNNPYRQLPDQIYELDIRESIKANK